MSRSTRNSFLLMLTALIWGVAFVAQSAGGDAVGPYSFNCIRSLIGGLVLLPVIFLLDRLGLTSRKPQSRQEWKTLITGGVSCGIILCLASNLQQVGITMGTAAGKAGFLTACYIVLVPIIGIFFHKRCPLNVWIGVGLTVIGLYLLCMTESLHLQGSDLLLLLCALAFSAHILVIDHFSPLVDGVRMSCIQFFISGLLTAIPMFLSDMHHSLTNLSSWSQPFTDFHSWIPILYAGIGSCGIAYTLQIIGQQDVNPTVASMILSLESVFSVLAGLVILGEKLSLRELLGCLFIFVAVVLAQFPEKAAGSQG